MYEGNFQDILKNSILEAMCDRKNVILVYNRLLKRHNSKFALETDLKNNIISTIGDI